MKKTKQEKGITLVALIITIIVLLILAAVTIRAVQGDGIIRYAQNASDKYTEKTNEEQGLLKEYEDYITTGVTGVNPKLNPSGVIPEGGVYYSNVEICTCQSLTNLEVNTGAACFDCDFIFSEPIKYEAGDNFPIPSARDLYQYGDYEYCYGYSYHASQSNWVGTCDSNTWAVKCTARKDIPGQLLESIAGKPLTNMAFAFWSSGIKDARNINIPKTVVNLESCFDNMGSLEYPPVIPEGVTNMSCTFYDCINLKQAPVIPSSVTNLTYTFSNCQNLSGVVTINANPTSYQGCFGTIYSSKDITLTGSSTMLQKLAKTSGEYHRRVFDADGNILQGWQ